MAAHSAALLAFDVSDAGVLRLFIAHMGGPFWRSRDTHGWSLPKGEFVPDAESVTEAARREFAEEIGVPVPAGEEIHLGEFRQSSAKTVHVLAVRVCEADLAFAASNEFEVEWPKGSRTMQSFPEVDRAEWFDAAVAREKLVKGQAPVIDALVAVLAASGQPVILADR